MRYERNCDLRITGAVHRHSHAYRRAKRKAMGVIEQAMGQCERPYLALSGGKDSAALLALCHEAFGPRELDLWAHVSDASFPGTVETIRACAERVGRPVEIDESPVSAFEVVGQQSRQKFGKRGYFFDAVARAAETHDLVFTGVRAAESKRRRKAYWVHGHIFATNTPAPIVRCDAIAHFTIEDVAAVLVEYDMPIHPIYDKIALSDKPVRLGYATSLDLVEKGTVQFLKRNYPALYNRLCQAWPDARDYV